MISLSVLNYLLKQKKKKNYILGNLPSVERSRKAGIKKVNEFRDGFLILMSIIKLLIFKK